MNKLADNVANPCDCRERERESYSLEDVSANEVSAVNNGIKIARAMYSMENTKHCSF